MQADLKQIDFLKGISEDSLARLSASAKALTFAANATLFRQGDPATETYFIVSGLASLEICAPGIGCRRIGTVARGELLGWSSLLSHKQLFATARSIDELEVFQVRGSVIQEICDTDPRFGYQLMKRTAETLAARLSAARLQLLDIFAQQATITPGADLGQS